MYVCQIDIVCVVVYVYTGSDIVCVCIWCMCVLYVCDVIYAFWRRACANMYMYIYV